MTRIAHPTPPDKSFWRNKSIEERQRWTDHFYINHPDIKAIFSDFLQKLEHCGRSGRYAGMLIIGPSGSGKTTLTRKMMAVANDLYGKTELERTICPVIQFAIPDPCTPLEFSVAILRALGDPNPRGRKNKASTIEAAERFLSECDVRLILLDNFQDIPARRAARGIELVGARLRELIDSSAALWVFLGTSEALKVVNSDPQLVKRISYKAHLRYFDIKEGAKTFLMLLQKVDMWLPLAEASCVSDARHAGLIYLATEGIFERLVQLVDSGWFLALKAGRETMLLEDLEAAFRFVHGPQPSATNPFHPEFVTHRLVAKGDPFEVMRGQ